MGVNGVSKHMSENDRNEQNLKIHKYHDKKILPHRRKFGGSATLKHPRCPRSRLAQEDRRVSVDRGSIVSCFVGNGNFSTANDASCPERSRVTSGVILHLYPRVYPREVANEMRERV